MTRFCIKCVFPDHFGGLGWYHKLDSKNFKKKSVEKIGLKSWFAFFDFFICYGLLCLDANFLKIFCSV